MKKKKTEIDIDEAIKELRCTGYKLAAIAGLIQVKGEGRCMDLSEVEVDGLYQLLHQLLHQISEDIFINTDIVTDRPYGAIP